jgi:hypothetical protein
MAGRSNTTTPNVYPQKIKRSEQKMKKLMVTSGVLMLVLTMALPAWCMDVTTASTGIVLTQAKDNGNHGDGDNGGFGPGDGTGTGDGDCDPSWGPGECTN